MNVTTISTIKKQKAIENQMHVKLYENLCLLRHLYPTTKDFDQHCRADMFVKNNKAAFQHTIYYLLKILASKEIKQKIPSWPILDQKLDAQFRKEIILYLNELRQGHPECGLPLVVASHLINPGGFKFTNLMLSVTELVMLEVLKSEGKYNLMLQPLPSANCPEQTQLTIAHLTKITAQIEASTADMLKNHLKTVLACEHEAETLWKQRVHTRTNINALKQKLEQLKSAPIVTFDYEQMNKIEKEVEDIQTFQKKFNHCISLLTYYKNRECFLEYNSYPPEANDVSRFQFNLLKHFDMFQKACFRKIFDVRPVSQSMIDEKLSIVEGNLKQYDVLLKRCSVLEAKQEVFLNDLKSSFQGVEEFSRTVQDTQKIPRIIITSLQ